jgi:hypothetical protein
MHTRARRVAALSILVWGGSLILGFTPARANAWNLFTDKTITGSGHVATEKRELATFQKIAVDLPCKVALVQGSSENVTIEADDNLLPRIETVVRNGQLTIRAAKGMAITSRSTIRVTVNARTIEGLAVAGSAELSAARLQSPKLAGDIAGSGSISIKGLQNEELSVSIAGSGRFEAQGASTTMDVSIAGSGDIRAARLSVQNVNVSIAGSGDATLWVRKTLTVSIAGSGNVQYYGEGSSRETSAAGSGRVKHMGTTPPM